MKKLLVLLFVLALAFPLAAQEGEYEEAEASQEHAKKPPTITFSGEAKTGVLWQERQDEGKEKEYSRVRIGNNDGDSGGNEGRFRLNMDYDNGNGLGFKARIDWETWTDFAPSRWGYAFGYGNFLNDQLTISVGKLGSSPWGTGGPEMWRELEAGIQGGARVEFKPGFIPEKVGKFNIGFVLNSYDQPAEASSNRTDATLLHIIQESVLGISYTHKYAHVRFGYRLDSDWDNRLREYEDEGDKFVYRIEERFFQNRFEKLKGFQIWALGYMDGFGAEGENADEYIDYKNWLFIQYAPDLFTAQIRLGFDYVDKRQVLYVKPSFYFNLLAIPAFKINKSMVNLLNLGASFAIAQDFGNRVNPDAPFHYIEVEPRLQINFHSSYLAFVYNIRRTFLEDYAEARGADPIRQDQFMNLRFCLYF